MFPSGKWVCVWQQHSIIDVERNLKLRFESGRITGDGHDGDGTFTYEGRCTRNGRVRLAKRYISGHVKGVVFIYEGLYDGEGVIYGEWWQRRHPSNRGPFEMRRFDRGEASTVRITRAVLEVPPPPAAEALEEILGERTRESAKQIG